VTPKGAVRQFGSTVGYPSDSLASCINLWLGLFCFHNVRLIAQPLQDQKEISLLVRHRCMLSNILAYYCVDQFFPRVGELASLRVIFNSQLAC